jgi:dolichol-phosphate mannosyltransferase
MADVRLNVAKDDPSVKPVDGAKHLDVDVSVIVPTYREVESLPHLIDRLSPLTSRFRSFELVIMDDDSNDGTEALVKKLALPWVRLVIRTKDRGLSKAVVEGLGMARYDTIVVMDADLSHPPEMLPRMVEESMAHEFVVGSRYVGGGGVDQGWSFFRWMNSKVATLMARPFTRVRDPMSGFFAFRRTVLARAAALNPVGYKIGLELIVKCDVHDVVEVPIHFSERKFGESKLSPREHLAYVRHIARLAVFKLRKR